MASFKLILLGLFAAAGTATCYRLSQNVTDVKSKIEGGDEICIEKAPYQVYLKYDGEYRCGGALIRADVVLTAAHCVYGIMNEISQLYVVAGTDKITPDSENEVTTGPIEIEVTHAEMYPKYDPKDMQKYALKYDIAVLKLSEKFPMTSTIGVIPLLLRSVKEGEEVLLTGFGMTDQNIFAPSPCLKAYKPKVVNCRNYLPAYLLTSDFSSVICHKCDFGCKSRSGDSGSPMVNAAGYLAGIHTGAFRDNVQVGVSVSYYSKWIYKLMNKFA